MTKLLALSFPNHDCSISYFDGNKVRYIKLERTMQIKRYATENLWDWKEQIKRHWNIYVEDVDKISIDFNRYRMPIYQQYNNFFNENKFEKFYDNLKTFFHIPTNKEVWYINHHYAHHLSVNLICNKDPDVSIVIDGYGNSRNRCVYKNDILVEYENNASNSIGKNILDLCFYLQIKAQHSNDMPGKLMGLQSYGNLNEEYLGLLRKYDIKNISEIFDINNSKGLENLDMVRTIHYRMGEVLLDFFKQHANKNDTIFYSGGVAQNVIWNTVLKKHFPNLVIPPYSSDEGLSLGGIELLRRISGLPRLSIENFPYSQSDVPSSETNDEVIKLAAKKLSEGCIVGWYQGQGEIGPRALGNRSILFDPRIPNGKDIINKIKRREYYRPFGASILKEYVNNYFDLEWEDEYMLYTCQVKTDELKSITHVDGTCRVQTVGDKNPIFRKLLEEFYRITGCPVLLNTSLNIAGRPLAGYPDITQELFLFNDIDCVFFGDRGLIKHNGDIE